MQGMNRWKPWLPQDSAQLLVPPIWEVFLAVFQNTFKHNWMSLFFTQQVLPSHYNVQLNSRDALRKSKLQRTKYVYN